MHFFHYYRANLDGQDVFWTLAPFFELVLYMFLGRGRILVWAWGHGECGRRTCVFSGSCGDSFLCTCMSLRWTWRNEYLCLTPVSAFWIYAPALWTLLPPGGTLFDMHSIWGGCCFGPWQLVFGPVQLFLGPSHPTHGGGNLDIETRCMQEVP